MEVVMEWWRGVLKRWSWYRGRRREREGEEAQRDDSERVEDEGEMRGEEGDSGEGRQREESEDRDFGGSKRARPGGPTFSDEDEIDMLEFVKANPVLYAKEHVHYVDKAKKDALWDKIGEQVGRSGQDVKRFQSQRTKYGKLTSDLNKSGSGHIMRRATVETAGFSCNTVSARSPNE